MMMMMSLMILAANALAYAPPNIVASATIAAPSIAGALATIVAATPAPKPHKKRNCSPSNLPFWQKLFTKTLSF